MKLKGEVEDMLFSTSDELQAIYDEFTNPFMRDLENKIDRRTWYDLESAVNVAVYYAAVYGFHVGYRFRENPTEYLFDPNPGDCNGDCNGDLLNQVDDD